MQKLKRLPLLVIIIAIFFVLGVSFAKVAKASFFSDLKSMVLGEEDDDEEEDDDNDEDEDDDKDENEDEDEDDEKEAAKKARENEREALKKSREAEREALKKQAELDDEDELDEEDGDLDEDGDEDEQDWKKGRLEALLKLKSEKEEMRKQFKEKFAAERCAKIQEKMKERTAHFNEKDGKHIKVYTNLVNRINKFIAKFDAAGLDTTAIKAHLAELQTKINKFKSDFAAYRAKLVESRNFTCGHAEGDFKAVLLEAKTLLKAVHADAADIRKYVRTTILADIKALKAQMPKEEESEDDGDDDKNKTEESEDSDDKDDDDKPVTTNNTDTTGATNTTNQ